MENFTRIAVGIDVAPALAELDAQPGLWDVQQARTRYAGSPHRETSDIWLRFRDPAKPLSPSAVIEPHFAVFYPAWYALPALHDIVFDLMARQRAVYLGGILITRLGAGKVVHAHHDRGSWHAEYLNRKVYVILRANRCVNWCDDERVTMLPGEAWCFENLKLHGVANLGETERIALIVTMRCEP